MVAVTDLEGLSVWCHCPLGHYEGLIFLNCVLLHTLSKKVKQESFYLVFVFTKDLWIYIFVKSLLIDLIGSLNWAMCDFFIVRYILRLKKKCFFESLVVLSLIVKIIISHLFFVC